MDDIAEFFRQAMEQDVERANRCHDFLKRPRSCSMSPTAHERSVSRERV
jgi:hypothetical protein